LVCFNNINGQPDAKITDFIDNSNQINTFRATISPILITLDVPSFSGAGCGSDHYLIAQLGTGKQVGVER